MTNESTFEVKYQGTSKFGSHHFKTIELVESPIVKKDDNIYINPKYAKDKFKNLDKSLDYILKIKYKSFEKEGNKDWFVCKVVDIKSKANILKYIKIKNKNQLEIVKCRDVKTPTGNKEDAGYDFYIPNDFKQTLLMPHNQINIPSGIKVNVPKDYALIAFNKSSIAKKQLQVGACVVDSGYTGEVHLHLFNVSNNGVLLKPGDKIFQFVLLPYIKPDIVIVNSFEKQSLRGDGAFGSTN